MRYSNLSGDCCARYWRELKKGGAGEQPLSFEGKAVG
jgi:hypothetical protein